MLFECCGIMFVAPNENINATLHEKMQIMECGSSSFYILIQKKLPNRDGVAIDKRWNYNTAFHCSY